MGRRGRILVVDDDAFSRTLYGDMLRESGHEVVAAAGGAEAIDLLRGGGFDAVIADIVMPEISGLAVLEAAQALARPVDVVIVTGHATVRNAVVALKSGAFDYITKPVDPDELKVSVERLLSQRSLLDENRELKSYVNLFRRTQALSTCLDREQIVRTSAEALVEELGAVAGEFVPAPEPAASKHDEEPVDSRAARGARARLGRALAKVLGGDPLAFSSVQVLEEKACKEVSEEAKLPPMGAGLVVPVRAGTSNFGALFVARAPGAAAFSLSELGKADFFGKHVGIALDNADKYAEAKELAFVDDLTELYNVRYLNFILDKEVKRARRYQTPLSVLFMDLDHLKGVNDKFGHLTGSRILIEVAGVIRRCVRDTDVMVRYGGDEYTILLPSTDSAGAMIVAERIRASVEKMDFKGEDGSVLKMTASLGVACFPEHAREKRDLLRIADAAMYHGKAKGRNTVYLASALLEPASAEKAGKGE
ncbi:MAG TPA: diguanylate cyclase [bacterium]|nr:diguanylate cyclase [bacterium]